MFYVHLSSVDPTLSSFNVMEQKFSVDNQA
jgi:hypothetical protein